MNKSDTWTECEHISLMIITLCAFVSCIIGPITWVLTLDGISNGVNACEWLRASIIMTCSGIGSLIVISYLARNEWKEYAWSFIPSVVATNCTLLIVIIQMGVHDPHCRLLLIDIPVENISNDVLLAVESYCYPLLMASFMFAFCMCLKMIYTSNPMYPHFELCAISLCYTLFYMYLSLLMGILLVFMCICDSGGGGVSGEGLFTVKPPAESTYDELL